MRRTSFVGALVAVALGAVLAFAIQGTPKDLDLHVTGLIILLAGLADLAVRFLIADSPLLSTQAAAVAAVVEPLGEPVLDVFGNPISPVAPPPGFEPVPMPAAGAMAQFEEPVYQEGPELLLGLGPDDPDWNGVGPNGMGLSGMGPEELGLSVEESRDRAMAHARARDLVLYEQAVAAAGDGEIPAQGMPATTLSGRPIRTRRRRRITR